MKKHSEDHLDLNSLLGSDPIKPKRRLPAWSKATLAAAAAVVLLITGFAGGFWVTTRQESPAQTTPPRVVDLNHADSEIIYENSIMTCHMYLEPLTEKPLPDGGYAFYDGIAYYGRDGWPEEFGDISTDRINFWLRVELTELGMEKYSPHGKLRLLVDGEPMEVNWDDTYLGVTPYYDPDTDVMKGWFVFGWLARQTRVELERSGVGNPMTCNIEISPVVHGSNLNSYSTQELADLVLHNDTFWLQHDQTVPEDLEDYIPLLALSRRADGAAALIGYTAHSDYTVSSRALAILRESVFQEKMTAEEKKLLTDYFTVKIYDYPLQLTSDGAFLHYFRDAYRSWHLSLSIDGMKDPPENINFYTRIDLSPYHKSQWDSSWQISLSYSYGVSGCELVTREYFDENGATAGWFIYGYIPEEVTVTATLESISYAFESTAVIKDKLSSTVITAIPIPADAKPPEVLYG